MSDKVVVGVGIILKNRDGKVLIGKRKGSHAPFYSIPGGHLDPGESFEEGAAREIKEETGLELNQNDLKVISITNNIDTYKDEGKHTISVIIYSETFSGEPVLCEPDKCEEWIWVKPDALPEPHFEASRKGIENYLSSSFYKK